jgi:hypothetical protein
MGLYDTINFDSGILPKSKKLPKAEKGFFESEEWLCDWQTKDFYSLMDLYVINSKGLFKQLYKDVKKPLAEYKQELKEWKEEPDKSTFHEIFKPKKTKSVKDRLLKVNHHGILRCYNIKNFGKHVYFIEYELKFTDGKLVKATLAEVTKHKRAEFSSALKKRIKEIAEKGS